MVATNELPMDKTRSEPWPTHNVSRYRIHCHSPATGKSTRRPHPPTSRVHDPRETPARYSAARIKLQHDSLQEKQITQALEPKMNVTVRRKKKIRTYRMH